MYSKPIFIQKTHSGEPPPDAGADAGAAAGAERTAVIIDASRRQKGRKKPFANRIRELDASGERPARRPVVETIF